MPEMITSAANPLVKRIRLLTSQGRKHRREQNAFVVEGLQPVWRAVTSGWPIEVLVADADLRSDSAAAAMLAEQEAKGIRVARLSPDLFLRLTSRDGSPGLIAIVRSRTTKLTGLSITEGSVFVALHHAGNPGNLGTIIRTADATGTQAVILIGDSTDPYAPQAVKASMGSLFAVEVVQVSDQEEFLTWAKTSGITVIATSGTARTDHWHAAYHPPLALLFGSEGDGLPKDLLDRADQQIRIPMTGTAESLNLAAAAAVMLYEVRRSSVD
jgi:RNA methyltransferase, TrmH family